MLSVSSWVWGRADCLSAVAVPRVWGRASDLLAVSVPVFQGQILHVKLPWWGRADTKHTILSAGTPEVPDVFYSNLN